MNDKIDSWKQKFPFGIEEIVKGLSNDNQLAIASLLMEKEEMHSSDIQKELNLKKDVLRIQLKIMSNFGIIRRTKTVWKEDKGIFDSHYMINPFYKKLIETMIDQCNRTMKQKTNVKIYTYKELKTMNSEQLKKVEAVKCPECKMIFKDDVTCSRLFFEKHAIRIYGICMTCEDKTRKPGLKIEDNFERLGKLMKREMEKEK